MTYAPPSIDAHQPDVPLRARAVTDVPAALHERRRRERGPYERYVKSVLDRIAAALLLIGLLPVLAVVAIAVYTRLGRPLFYTQRRVGRFGQPFRMFKFRTMEQDRRSREAPYAGPDRRVRHKTPDDPRHTRLGRWLRRYSLDELPQLLNVVKGELSLVGPRPELVGVVERYECWQHGRHAIRPGLTGLWQVTARDEGGEMHRHVDLDLRYIAGLSLRTDMVIALLTVPVLLGRQPAPRLGIDRVGEREPAPRRLRRRVTVSA